MLLSNLDIKRLERKGHRRDSFVRFDAEGYAMLRNRQGCCVFYDAVEQRCNVYSFRPLGCRIYPVMHDEDRGIVIDEICRAQADMSEAEKAKRGKRVLRLLKKIDEEAAKRAVK